MIDARIDFLFVIVADHCNPNGDPIERNYPRIDFNGYGEISDVCIKRKIRNRLQDMGYEILNKANDRSDDGYHDLRSRINACEPFKTEMDKKNQDIFQKIERCHSIACDKWADVRFFGQVFPLKGGSEVTFNVRGPVSITFAISIAPVDVCLQKITKSIYHDAADGKIKDPSTLGQKYMINKGVYISKGSIYPSLAKKTGFTYDDAATLKKCLETLFENDASSARPAGSMNIDRLYWWDHKQSQKIYPPAAVFQSIDFKPEDKYPFYTATLKQIPDMTEPDIYRGLVF